MQTGLRPSVVITAQTPDEFWKQTYQRRAIDILKEFRRDHYRPQMYEIIHADAGTTLSIEGRGTFTLCLREWPDYKIFVEIKIVESERTLTKQVSLPDAWIDLYNGVRELGYIDHIFERRTWD